MIKRKEKKRMDELLFNAMNIPNEVKRVLDETEDNVCNGMTDSERKAYHCGVANTLSVMRSLLELDEELTIHIPSLNKIVEMDIEELEEIFVSK
jgi:hypothetical protein